MHTLHANKVGLVFGGLLALVHAFWALAVFLGFADPLLNWIMALHFLNFQYAIAPFTLGNAVFLVIVTGIIGYIVGYIVGWLWNYVHGVAKNG